MYRIRCTHALFAGVYFMRYTVGNVSAAFFKEWLGLKKAAGGGGGGNHDQDGLNALVRSVS